MSFVVMALGTLALGATFEGVKTDLHEGTLRVDVQTSETVRENDLNAKIEGGKLHIYVKGGQVHAGRTTFPMATLPVEAKSRTDYAKLEVSLGRGLSCHGPITLSPTSNGARAEVACEERGPEAAVVKAPSREQRVRVPAPPKAEAETPAAAPAAAVAARPAAPPAAENLPIAPAPRSPLPAPRGEGQGEGVGIVAAGAVASAAAEAPRPAPSSGPSASFILGALLAAVGVGAFFFAKRRAQKPSVIRIVETASLGPKRALVVAQVNGETLVLGSSEAGITFLRSLDQPNAPFGEAAPVRPMNREVSRMFPVARETQEQAPSNAEASYLSKLFQRNVKPLTDSDTGTRIPQEISDPNRTFAEALAELSGPAGDGGDSARDEDLRRRLANGMAGKVA